MITFKLRERLTDGTYQPGDRLPSERLWCEEFGVTRNTLRRALAELESLKLITVVPGSGRIAGDPDSDEVKAAGPAYERIAADLRELIENGEYGEGDPLPSELKISKLYGVARYTARQALADLEDAGLVKRVPGKGRFLRPRRP
ncbi:GntR family transcriptional regulator [Actinomadura rudentiformis]|uniref:GntR family transcriptional regulator n=1 Tax=Actinomadura rudentiformis TaxID=359158 RepID=UPI001CEF867B|nr:GntR family transcriptional regulator [Actinomadura rudentiformis]